MKSIMLLFLAFSFISSALAFRGGGGGGGGFRGGGGFGGNVGTGANIGSGTVGTGANVGDGSVGSGTNLGAGAVGTGNNANLAVGAAGARHVAAHRSAAMGAYYHSYYPYSYWGWYGYAPYHYYYPASTSTTVYVEGSPTQAAPKEVGSVVNEVPSNCKSETVKKINYKHCGDTWYEPQFAGTELEYVIVVPGQL